MLHETTTLEEERRLLTLEFAAEAEELRLDRDEAEEEEIDALIDDDLALDLTLLLEKAQTPPLEALPEL